MTKHKITWVPVCILITTLVISSCTPQNQAINIPSASSAITPLAALTTDSLEPIYEDDFSTAKWPVAPTENTTPAYKNGEYELTCKSDAVSWFRAPFPKQSNGVAEVDARVVSGTVSTNYGICFRMGDKEFYRFVISGSSYEIDKYLQENWSVILPYSKSQYIKTDGSANRIRIAYLGNTIEAYINGQRVATVTDGSFADGYVGLAVGGKDSVVAFDNFKLYRFTDAYFARAVPTSATSNPVVTTASTGGSSVQSLKPSGGKVTINKAGDALNGLEITVPDSAYPDTQNFNISSAPAPSINIPDVNVISPLITINNAGNTSNLPITLKIPVKILTDEFAMVFYYNSSTGKLEGVPLLEEDENSITVSTRRFNPVIVLSIKKQKLIEKEAQEIQSGLYTGFLPGRDDWQIPNRGSYISTGGNCAGMSLTALWYFLEEVKASKNSSPPRLNKLYIGRDPDPKFWEDDVTSPPVGFRGSEGLYRDAYQKG